MAAAPILTGDWYLGLPERYRDRVKFDPRTGQPTSIDIGPGAYTVPGELTNVDRRACRIPPRTVRPEPRQQWDPPA